jgi:hypothetical protein
VRLWDGEGWTLLVADRGEAELEDLGPVRRARFRRIALIAGGSILALALTFWGVNSCIEQVARNRTATVRDELDGWVLPDTVVRASRPDRVNVGQPGLSNDSFTRYYASRSADTRHAAEDLVAELRRQGYDLTEEDVYIGGRRTKGWDGACTATKYCQMTIALDDTGKLIEVELTP